jgi:hypothetical protein
VKINGNATVLFSAATENGADPFQAFASLTLVQIPEPSCLSAAAIAAVGVLARRRR